MHSINTGYPMPFDSTPASAGTDATLTCPKCSAGFQPRRGNQVYCSDRCRKNATRGPRTVAESLIERTRCARQWDRARTLYERLYKTPPQDRVALMARLVMHARDEDAELRNILTDPRLLAPICAKSTGKPRGLDDWSTLTISQAANAWCRHVTGYGVADVVHKRCDWPEDALTRGINDPDLAAVLFFRKSRKPRPPRPEGWDYRSLLPAKFRLHTDMEVPKCGPG
jgi:hypothetical protein